MGVASGCGCKEVYRFPHTLTPLVSALFSAASLFFVHLKKCFFVLVPLLFVVIYVMIFFARYKHTYG